MSKVLFLVNHDVVIYNFRLELVERLLADGHKVVISSPYGERIDDLVKLGCEFKEIEISRHGMNPVKELKLISDYKKLIKEVRPDVVFYGEGWTMSTSVTKDNVSMTTQGNSSKVPGFAFFNDTFRDAIKGSVFDYGTGYVSGAAGLEEKIPMCGILP